MLEEVDKGKFQLNLSKVEIVQIIAILFSIVPLVMFIRLFGGRKKDDEEDENASEDRIINE